MNRSAAPNLRTRSLPILSLAAAAGLAITPAGCASGPGQGPGNSPLAAEGPEQSNPWSLPATPTITELLKLAEKNRGGKPEIGEPPATVAFALLDGDAEPELGPPGATPEQLIALLPPLPEPPEPIDIGAEAEDEALKLYVEGRAALRSGDLEPAVRALSAAAATNPNSAESWRLLGEAQQSRGGRSAAIRAFERAVELGDREPRALLFLATEVGRRGNGQQAASYYAAAAKSDDEVVRIAARVGLAEAMVGLGQPAAAYTTLRDALAPFEPGFAERIGRTTAHRDILGSLVRRAAGLWQTAGDMALSQSKPEEARAAYRRAQQLAPATDPALRDRIVYAYVQTGNPERASLELLGELWNRGGQADESVLSMISYLSQAPSLSSRLGAAVAELSSELPGPMSPASQVGLVLAGAAAQPPEAAYETLLRAVERFPDEPELVRAAIATAGDDDGAATRRGAGLVSVTPAMAHRIAKDLLRGNRAWSEIEAALLADLDADAGAALLGAWMYSELGLHADAADAADRATTLSSDAPLGLRAASLSAATELAAEACRYADSDLRLAELEQIASGQPAAQYELGLAYSALGRHSDAAVAFRAALNSAERRGLRRDLLIALGQAEAALGSHAVAAAQFEKAIEIDERSEIAHTQLIEIYRKGGSLDNEQKLSAVVTRLREQSPNGPAFRWLVVQELVARRDFAEASSEMTALLDSGEIEMQAMLRFVDLHRRLGRLVSAEEWLGERLETMPESEALAVGLIQTLLASNRPRAAADAAAAWLALRPTEGVMRLHEMTLRQLNENEEAAVELRKRVALTGPTIANGIELADQAIDDGDLAAATETLARRLPAGAPRIDAAEAEGLSNVLRRAGLSYSTAAQDPRGRINPAAIEMDAEEFAQLSTKFAALVDTTIAMGAVPPAQINGLRVLAIASAEKFDLERLRLAIIETIELRPSDNPDLWLTASQVLVQVDRNTESLDLMEAALAEEPNSEIAVRLARLAAEFAPYDRFEPIAQRIVDLGLTSSVNDVLRPNRGINDDGRDGSLAECVYIIGSYAMGANRAEVAERAYRRVLELQPKHPWANNDLGYALADKGENLEEAERMIRTAYEALPDQASVVDSLGWVLYKLGQIEDGVGADGEFQEGAVSLLEKAARMPEGQDNWEVQDHLGDARYLSGDTIGARQAWQISKRLLDGIMSQLPPTQPIPERYLPFKRAQDRVLEKLRAMSSGLPPQVAPSGADGGVNQ